MPYMHTESRRRMFSKPKYRVTKWPEYNAALQRRGDLTIWFTEEAEATWSAEKTGRRGGHPIYSDLAIETALTMRLVFKQALRQTVGLLRSLTGLPKLDDLHVPDYSTLSRRGQRLKVSIKVNRSANLAMHRYCPVVGKQIIRPHLTPNLPLCSAGAHLLTFLVGADLQ